MPQVSHVSRADLHHALWEGVIEPYNAESRKAGRLQSDISVRTHGYNTMIYTEKSRFFRKRLEPLILIDQFANAIEMRVTSEGRKHAQLVESVNETVEFFRSFIPEPEPPWEVRLERDDLSVLTAKNKLVGLLYFLEQGTVVSQEHLGIISPNKTRSRSAAIRKIDESVLVRPPESHGYIKGRIYTGRDELLRLYPEAGEIYEAHPKLQVEAKRIQGESPPLSNSNYQLLLTKKKEEKIGKELEALRQKRAQDEESERGPGTVLHEFVETLGKLDEAMGAQPHTHAQPRTQPPPYLQPPLDSRTPAKGERTRVHGKIRVVVPEEGDRKSHVEVFADLEAKVMETVGMTPGVARALNLKSLASPETNTMGKMGYGYNADIAGMEVAVHVDSLFQVQEGCFLPEINGITLATSYLLRGSRAKRLHDDLIPAYLGLIDRLDNIKHDKEDGTIHVPKRGYMSREFVEGFGGYLAHVEMLDMKGGILNRLNQARNDMDSDDPATRKKGHYDLPNRFRYYTPDSVKMDSKILGVALADAVENALVV